jgi:hypothetical protein
VLVLPAEVASRRGRLAARVPQLPRPSGPHLVGSVVFHWTDVQRPETFATSAGERRQVVAYWYIGSFILLDVGGFGHGCAVRRFHELP